jgi:hypothetical protein
MKLNVCLNEPIHDASVATGGHPNKTLVKALGDPPPPVRHLNPEALQVVRAKKENSEDEPNCAGAGTYPGGELESRI